jgi:uncharacterized membrane protein YidH (DUF202 family)
MRQTQVAAQKVLPRAILYPLESSGEDMSRWQYPMSNVEIISVYRTPPQFFALFFVSSLGEPNNTAANERTFLAWIRTSIALSMLGAIIAQLFRLQNVPSPTGVISLYLLAIPLACICQGAALLTALTGGHRYWRMQNAMARGEALAAGWEFWLIIVVSGSVSRPPLISIHSVADFTDGREDASHTLCCYSRACLNVVGEHDEGRTSPIPPHQLNSEIGDPHKRYKARSSNAEQHNFLYANEPAYCLRRLSV